MSRVRTNQTQQGIKEFYFVDNLSPLIDYRSSIASDTNRGGSTTVSGMDGGVGGTAKETGGCCSSSVSPKESLASVTYTSQKLTVQQQPAFRQIANEFRLHEMWQKYVIENA